MERETWVACSRSESKLRHNTAQQGGQPARRSACFSYSKVSGRLLITLDVREQSQWTPSSPFNGLSSSWPIAFRSYFPSRPASRFSFRPQDRRRASTSLLYESSHRPARGSQRSRSRHHEHTRLRPQSENRRSASASTHGSIVSLCRTRRTFSFCSACTPPIRQEPRG